MKEWQQEGRKKEWQQERRKERAATKLERKSGNKNVGKKEWSQESKEERVSTGVEAIERKEKFKQEFKQPNHGKISGNSALAR